jgi:hypothetical protein
MMKIDSTTIDPDVMAQIKSSLEARLKEGNLIFTVSEQNKLIVELYADILQLHKSYASIYGEDCGLCERLRSSLARIETWCHNEDPESMKVG